MPSYPDLETLWMVRWTDCIAAFKLSRHNTMVAEHLLLNHTEDEGTHAALSNSRISYSIW